MRHTPWKVTPPRLKDRVSKAWGRFLCSRGHHAMRSTETGLEVLPLHVGVCRRCGRVRDVVATPFGGVVLGEWDSLDEFLKARKERHGKRT